MKYDLWIGWEQFLKMSEICFSYTWHIFWCEICETCYFRISKRVKSVFHTNYNPFRTEIWKWVKYVFSIKWNYFSEMSDISFFIWVKSFFNIVKWVFQNDWNQFYKISVASSLKRMKYVFSNMWNRCLNWSFETSTICFWMSEIVLLNDWSMCFGISEISVSKWVNLVFEMSEITFSKWAKPILWNDLNMCFDTSEISVLKWIKLVF